MARARLVAEVAVAVLVLGAIGCSTGAGGSDAGKTTAPLAASAPVDPALRWYQPVGEGMHLVALPSSGDGPLMIVTSTETGQHALQTITEPPSSSNDPAESVAADAVVAIGDDKLAVAQGGRLVVRALSGQPQFSAALPPGAAIAALATGYGDVVFAIDGATGTLYAVTPDGPTQLLADSSLADAVVALVVGGQLVVGGPTGLVGCGLADLHCAAIGALGPVADLARDDLGNYVVLSPRGEVRSVSPEGVPGAVLREASTAVAFDASSATLFLGDATGVTALDYRRLTGRPEAPTDEVGPFAANGIALSGAEYWPRHGDDEPNYPADILWGFYPRQGEMFDGAASVATATPAAVACMEQSHAALRAWVASNPTQLLHAQRRFPATISARLYLWVNDYSTANDPFPHALRPARLWYWQRDPAVVGRIPGYWKWETTVLQDGTCTFPQPAQAAEAIEAKIAEAAALAH